jgi:hypothetical protein
MIWHVASAFRELRPPSGFTGWFQADLPYTLGLVASIHHSDRKDMSDIRLRISEFSPRWEHPYELASDA